MCVCVCMCAVCMCAWQCKMVGLHGQVIKNHVDDLRG